MVDHSILSLQSLLDEMCIPRDLPQLKALMKEMDKDRSGEVDFDEVTKASPMNSKPPPHLRNIQHPLYETRSVREESFLS